jgi:hypothetical protein
MKKPNCRSKESGQVLVIVIILILVVGGGLWYLVSYKQAMDKAGRAFGHEVIQRIVINRDLAFLSASLSPQEKLDFPPSDRQQLIKQLTELGIPVQPFQTEENMTWEKLAGLELFGPKGFFTAHLNYPAGPVTLRIAFDHPVGKWQIVNLEFVPPSTAR